MDNPQTRKSSYRKRKKNDSSDAGDTAAASTAPGAGTPAKQMMEYDEDLGEFVEVPAAGQTSAPTPPNERGRGPAKRKRVRKRQQKAGRPPSHTGSTVKRSRHPPRHDASSTGDKQNRRPSPRVTHPPTGGKQVLRRSPRRALDGGGDE